MRNDFECILLVKMLKRKPRNRSNISSRPVKKQKITSNTPHTSAQPPTCSALRQNLTDDDAEGDDGPSFTRTQLLDLCQQLEIGCMQHGDPQSALRLSPSKLCIFCAKLQCKELLNAKQTSTDSNFKV